MNNEELTTRLKEAKRARYERECEYFMNSVDAVQDLFNATLEAHLETAIANGRDFVGISFAKSNISEYAWYGLRMMPKYGNLYLPFSRSKRYIPRVFRPYLKAIAVDYEWDDSISVSFQIKA